MFKWCVVKCSFDDKYQKDMLCKRDWTRYSKIVDYSLINTTTTTIIIIEMTKIIGGTYMIIQEEIQGSLSC